MCPPPTFFGKSGSRAGEMDLKKPGLGMSTGTEPRQHRELSAATAAALMPPAAFSRRSDAKLIGRWGWASGSAAVAPLCCGKRWFFPRTRLQRLINPDDGRRCPSGHARNPGKRGRNQAADVAEVIWHAAPPAFAARVLINVAVTTRHFDPRR